MSTARILIVADDATATRELSLHLERAGYATVGTASRADQAVALAGELQPDLALIDCPLTSGLDGIAAATQIRQKHAVPVVFTTAHGDESLLHRASPADALGCIPRPLEQRQLRSAIETALHRHRGEAALRKSESRFRRLFEAVSDAVLLIDPQTGLILDANTKAERILGRSRELLAGIEHSRLYPPAQASHYVDRLLSRASVPTSEPIDAEIVTAEGRIVPVEMNGNPLELDDGHATYLVIFRDVGPKRAAERGLRAHQARVDAIFRAAPAGIGMLVDDVITECNPKLCELTGYSEHELLGRSSRLLFAAQEEFERVDREKRRAISECCTEPVESRWRRKDGRLVDVLLSFTPIESTDSSPGAVFAAIDVSERNRIRGELRLRNRILEGLQPISHAMQGPAALAAFDRIASEVATMLGFRFASVMLHRPATGTLRFVGLHGFDVGSTFPREIPARQTLAALVLERGSPVVESETSTIHERLHPDLQRFPVQLFAGVPMIANDRILGVLAVAHDQRCAVEPLVLDQLSSIANHIAALVERREAEAARHDSETELLAIYQHAPVILCLLDEENRIIRANPAAARFAGRHLDELRGARGGEFLSCLGALTDSRGCGFGDQCPSCVMRATIADTFHSGNRHVQVEVTKRVRTPGGTRDAHMLLSTACIDLDGKRRILVVLEDITENRRLTEHLMRAQRMESIGTLASGIAHDLNNVLSPIVMCLSMLRDSTPDVSLLESIDTMQTAARRGADIVRQMLTFARGPGGEHVEIQPKHIVQETARIARETFPRSIEVTSDFVHDPRTFLGDPTQIQQVLMNLCVNARDAMHKGGKLGISVSHTTSIPSDAIPSVERDREGSFIVITVRDTGCGMSPDIVQRIFDPYFSTKPAGRGTGLGLAVTLGIVERHGGCIHVESAPGVGTTFRIFLPVAAAKPRMEPAPALDDSDLSGQGQTILLVDDEPSARTILGGMLERAGYRMVVTREGSEALDRLNTPGLTVNMLITDLMMPGMGGLELIRQARELRPDLPILAMSGLGEDEIRASAAEAGADHIIPKPFTHRTLLRAASSLLRQNRI